jgi:hypothetical protein
MPHPFVPKVNLKNDGSVDVVVEIVHIEAGHWADVSGCVIQEATAPGTEIPAINVFAPFSATLAVPAAPSADSVPTVTVNVPDLNLNPAADVKVIARVTEALIWPTTLGSASAERLPGITATWEALPDNPGTSGGPNPWSGR